MEQKVESRRPWDSSSAKDPAELRLDHSRYSRVSSPYRPYHPVEEHDETITHAARECVSMAFHRGHGSPVTGRRQVFCVARQWLSVAVH